MSDSQKKVVIAGAGGIGSAAALILREWGDFGVDVYLGDARLSAAENAAEWINGDSRKVGKIEPFTVPLVGTSPELEKIVRDGDILLDCLPGKEAPRIAGLARQHGLHYANLTEYVRETDVIRQLAQDSNQGFILQTGLAPGFINVLAMDLLKKFCENYDVAEVESISMKVGALTKNATPPSYYGFTWSPIGVATEYIEPAVVIRGGKKTTVESLSERAPVLINGALYEEAITSGGTADLPGQLEGRVGTLDYKTLRHPGHYNWVDGIVGAASKSVPENLPSEERNRILADLVEREMMKVVPLVEDDVVIIYASVKGKDSDGALRVMEQAYNIGPTNVGNKTLRAIQSTTASALAESARLLLTGNYRGVVLQSLIDPSSFMKGQFITRAYNNNHSLPR